MPSAPAIIYDLDMNKVAYLENAMTVGYEQPMNGLWKAQFTLPANDPKNDECNPFYFVELFEDGKRLDLFRIMPTTAIRDVRSMTITYECEHVLATLIDDVLFQYHTVGNLGVYTGDVIDYILQRQTIKRWSVGTIEFMHQFEYNWENENLLSSLNSVPKPFVDEFMWTWNTETYPWKLNLVKPSDNVVADIKYGVNMQGVEKKVDPTNLCTRLYGLGYGEGVNQLNFSDINDGKPYLDADTQAQFGIISDIFVDRRFESAETLLARCQAILNERKIPRVSYLVDATELQAITKDPIHKFTTGSKIKVMDKEMGIDVEVRVVNKRKRDYLGQPGIAELEISNKKIDIAELFNELETRQRINDLYAQGATNILSHDYADNCDPQHPAVMKFWIPEGTARINKASLAYQSEAFRAYSKAIEGGGALSTSTASGGGAIESSESPDYTDTTYTTQGMVGIPTTDVRGGHYHNLDISDSGNHWHNVSGNQTSIEGAHTHPGSTSDYDGDHSHAIEDHDHYLDLIPHTHKVQLPSHTHGFSLPNHTHEIDYGIFAGPTPSSVIVKVDGNEVVDLGTIENEVDLIPYLSTDDEGKIMRGVWHTIEITPNSLGRIVANVNIQLFVQSRGGGNY